MVRRDRLSAARCRQCLLGFLVLMSTQIAFAAQATLSRTFTGAADVVDNALMSSGMTVKERADTDRFVILYAEGVDQQSVAVTVFSLPDQTDRVTVTVNSASPADEHFDHQLLRSLQAQLLAP